MPTEQELLLHELKRLRARLVDASETESNTMRLAYLAEALRIAERTLASLADEGGDHDSV
jgi:hypothetical protein